MKTKYRILLLLSFIFLLSFTFIACSNNSSSAVYYAHYGEWFSLPLNALSVVDSKGENVYVNAGRIFIDKTDNYTINLQGNKAVAKLEIINSRKPVILGGIEIGYGVKGQNTNLAKFTANDGVVSIDTHYEMFFGSEKIEIIDYFIPQYIGEYTLRVSATSSAGKTSIKEVPYYIEESQADFQNKITSFDKPYGVNQGSFKKGYAEYSTEFKIDGQNGSTRLKLDPMLVHGSYEFTLANLNNPDVTKFDALYFYAYNDCEIDLELYFNWAKSYILTSKSWTRIELRSNEFRNVLLSTGAYENIANNLQLTDINGLNINISLNNKHIFKRNDSIYLSAMCGLNKISSSLLQQDIAQVLNSGTVTEEETGNFSFYYSMLSSSQQKNVTAFPTLQDFLIEQELIKLNLEKVEDKILYFDHEVGRNQISALWGVQSYEISDAFKYNNKSTLKVVSTAWDLALSIDKPFIYDITKYSLLRFAIYNGANRDLLLYNTNGSYKNIGDGEDVVLKAKQWNVIEIPITEARDLIGSTLWILPNSFSDKPGVPIGTEFYISAMYGVK